jgi:hypothetical protein
VDVKFKLFDSYVLDQDDDQVEWIRIFADEARLMTGRGVYRDDVLVLLFPLQIDRIQDLAALRKSVQMDTLPVWNKTRYLVHMGNANQGYPVQEAVETVDGRHLEREEVLDLVGRIEDVFK